MSKKVSVPSDSAFISGLSKAELRSLSSNVVSPDDLEDKEVRCTACFKQVNHKMQGVTVRHPLLGVVMCKSCRSEYISGVWKKDEEGYFEHCRWCGEGGELVCCCEESCHNVFCRRCLKRNLGRSAVTEIVEKDDWKCIQCDTSQIKEQRALFYSIYQFWMKEDAKVQAMKAKKKTLEEESQDTIAQLIKEATLVQKVMKKYLDEANKSWRKKRSATKGDKEIGEASVKAAGKLRKVLAITKKNLDKLDSNIPVKVAKKFPTIDVSPLKNDVQVADEGSQDVFSDTEDQSNGFSAMDVSAAEDDDEMEIEEVEEVIEEEKPPTRESKRASKNGTSNAKPKPKSAKDQENGKC